MLASEQDHSMTEEAQKLIKRINQLRRELSILPALDERHDDLEIEEYQNIVLELEEKLIILRHLISNPAPSKQGQKPKESQSISTTKDDSANQILSNLNEHIESIEKEETPTESPNEALAEQETVEFSDSSEEEAAEAEPIQNIDLQEINEASAAADSLVEQLSKTPISDLRHAFGLNERFFYANELFGGNGEEFTRAINEFNHLESFEDASRLIESKYEREFGWDRDHEDVISFIEIIERRYL